MKKIALFFLLCVTALPLVGQVVTNTQTISSSGNSIIVTNSIDVINASFLHTWSGGQTGITFSVYGCISSPCSPNVNTGCCNLIAQDSSVSTVALSPILSTIYPYFLITATYSGGGSVTVLTTLTGTNSPSSSAAWPNLTFPNAGLNTANFADTQGALLGSAAGDAQLWLIGNASPGYNGMSAQLAAINALATKGTAIQQFENSQPCPHVTVDNGTTVISDFTGANIVCFGNSTALGQVAVMPDGTQWSGSTSIGGTGGMLVRSHGFSINDTGGGSLFTIFGTGSGTFVQLGGIINATHIGVGVNVKSTATITNCLGTSSNTANIMRVGEAYDAGGGGPGSCYDDFDAYTVRSGNLAGVTVTAMGISPTASNTSIIATTLAQAPASATALYSIGGYISTTIIGSSCAGSTTVVFNVISTDPAAAGSATTALGTYTISSGGNNGTVGEFHSFAPMIFAAKQGTNVQFSTTYTAGGSCSPAPTVKVYPTALRLQ